METTLFDGEILAGPVPTLFSDEEDATLTAIEADPCKAHWDLTKIVKTLFMPESVDILDAVDILKKPREGSAVFSFKRPRLTRLILETYLAEQGDANEDTNLHRGSGLPDSDDRRVHSPSRRSSKRARSVSESETGVLT